MFPMLASTPAKEDLCEQLHSWTLVLPAMLIQLLVELCIQIEGLSIMISNPESCCGAVATFQPQTECNYRDGAARSTDPKMDSNSQTGPPSTSITVKPSRPVAYSPNSVRFSWAK